MMKKRKRRPKKRVYRPYNKPLTEQQKEAVRLQCMGLLNVQDTAALLGVHRSTIWRWSLNRQYNKEWKRLLREWELIHLPNLYRAGKHLH